MSWGGGPADDALASPSCLGDGGSSSMGASPVLSTFRGIRPVRSVDDAESARSCWVASCLAGLRGSRGCLPRLS